MTDRAYDLAERANIPIEFAEYASRSQAHTALNSAWKTLKQCQKEAVELRSKWLEGVARVKASDKNDKNAAQVLKTMIKNLHDKRMHAKLTRITNKGQRHGLDFIEIPTGEWYYSVEKNELYHFTKGVFETHQAHPRQPRQFIHHHTLKVINDDAMQVTMHPWTNRGCPKGYRMKNGLPIGPIEWKKISDKEEMEKLLMERNKRHLQQMAMENTPPSTKNTKEAIKFDGTDEKGDRILRNEVTTELDQFPRVIRTWFRQFTRSKEEQEKCTPIDGYIRRTDFQQAFKEVKERTSPSPSGIHYIFWKCIATDDDISDYMAVMMRLPFMHGFPNAIWSRCIDVMLEKKSGVRQIHELRIIGLVVADFNTAIKIFFAKQMMKRPPRQDCYRRSNEKNACF